MSRNELRTMKFNHDKVGVNTTPTSDYSDMFEPKHDNGFEEEMTVGTWAWCVAFILVLAVGIVIADHYQLSIY